MHDLEILTVDQVADVVQLSSKTVLRAIAAGHLEASRLGQGRAGWRVKKGAVGRWMELRSNASACAQARIVSALPAPMPAPDATRRRPGRLTISADMGRL